MHRIGRIGEQPRSGFEIVSPCSLPSMIRENACGVMVYVLDNGILISDFEIQPRYSSS